MTFERAEVSHGKNAQFAKLAHTVECFFIQHIKQ